MLWGNIMARIWIDLDNAPHVPLFRPIITALQNRGHTLDITARDFTQTLPLLDMWGIEYNAVGKHGGGGKTGKIVNLFVRADQLRRHIRSRNIDLALSHGSRTQLVVSRVLSIKSVLMLDYEYTESFIFNKTADYILMPSLIPADRLINAGFNMKKLLTYPFFKEELYLDNFIPDTSLRKSLGIPRESILVLIRPSAMLGNYHNKLSEKIIIKILSDISKEKTIYALVVSRTKEDADLIKGSNFNNVHFLDTPVDGLQLIWNSDLVISGGGTMNRESALLGTPTYSVFTGRKPYLDEYLSSQSKLTFIDTVEKTSGIRFAKRDIKTEFKPLHSSPAESIAEILEGIINE